MNLSHIFKHFFQYSKWTLRNFITRPLSKLLYPELIEEYFSFRQVYHVTTQDNYAAYTSTWWQCLAQDPEDAVRAFIESKNPIENCDYTIIVCTPSGNYLKYSAEVKIKTRILIFKNKR